MSLSSDKNGDTRRKADLPSDDPKAKTASLPGGKPKEGPGVGQALRTVYQRTIEEDIPPEMLDLLGKLN